MKKILILMLILASISHATININSCSNLNISGETYLLTTDIIDSGTSYCINITANNIIFNCQGHLIDGNDIAEVGIFADSVKNIEIKNCNLKDWNTSAIFFNNVNNSKLSNLIISSCPIAGIELDLSNYNSLINLTLNANDYGGIVILPSIGYNNLSNIYINSNNITDSVGIYISPYDVGYSADYNTLQNITILSNDYGIIFETSNYNTISSCIVRDNTIGVNFAYSKYNTLYGSQIIHNSKQGIYLEDSNHSKIYFNRIEGNGFGATPIQAGIFLSDYSTNNLIYNNLFNNSVNVYFFTSPSPNNWNVAIQSGVRIFSPGSKIGGNYWTDPSGVEFSDYCSKKMRLDGTKYFCHSDGFCNRPNFLAPNNVDYAPLCTYYFTMSGATTTIPEIPELVVEPSPFEIIITDDCQTELLYVTWTGKSSVKIKIHSSPTISKYFTTFPVPEISLSPKKTTAIPFKACLPKDVISVEGKLTVFVVGFPEYKEVPTIIKRGKPLPKVVCGDGICSKGENWWTCPEDCPFPYGYIIILIIIGVIIYLITS